ncbi:MULTISPECIES: FMN-dependent NADH-azoreductase [Proteus]|jgi:FMN-dependent NADH-azoreductase|uniref:FMN dependent NADH:quinone oxidoreductase n=1 Tax=Proteus vulgaris TaxID=585 RepID=A0A379FE12_PROVU|nr:MULTISPECIES: FMN-dependent NADH-azoreductase [Proteus]AYY80713.1 FMN-dependent NADH-azoreductase [Proteus vulgaris]MBI6510044.1 FMN-dependent NADH-azoreductase [Proteus sp. PR00174]MCH4254552.1 FMN-dependent NADH-azoreductase [Proteus vulgaris]MDM3563426.1 FMN-dependent NADH-azoreductase [Proteus vulgaris]NBN76349.1 FMN-dependent NADH-azoreductase [Proteus sp. G2615]
MKKILVLKSSILESYSHSNKMADYLIENWQNNYKDDVITVRDLAKNTVPTLDQATLFAFGQETEMLSDEQKVARALSDELISELKSHDMIIITAPMYNFSIPAQLKHYIDYIARAGETFKYTEAGSVGLLENKQAIVLTSRGGVHKDQPSDLIVPFLKQFLAFIGIHDVQFIMAEGTAFGEEYTQQAHLQAQKEIDAVIDTRSITVK